MRLSAFIFMFSLFTIITSSSDIIASSEYIVTQDMIAEKNKAMITAMNANKQEIPAVKFLHNYISDDAEFEIKVNNTTAPKSVQNQTIEMNKTEYINSYIQGTDLIDNYNFDIKTLDTKYLPEKDIFVSNEILTETGTALNPYNLSEKGRDFISKTKCSTFHRLREGKLISIGANCKTDVSYSNMI